MMISPKPWAPWTQPGLNAKAGSPGALRQLSEHGFFPWPLPLELRLVWALPFKYFRVSQWFHGFSFPIPPQTLRWGPDWHKECEYTLTGRKLHSRTPVLEGPLATLRGMRKAEQWHTLFWRKETRLGFLRSKCSLSSTHLLGDLELVISSL